MGRHRFIWAARKTGWSLRKHLREEVGLGAVALVISVVVAHKFHSQRQSVSTAFTGLLYTVGAAGTVLVGAFVVNYLRADLAIALDRLQPGPEQVAAEQGRVRDLRRLVAIVHADVADAKASLRRMVEQGLYWDPGREDFVLSRFVASDGNLAKDPRTLAAFRAVDDLRREMHRVTLIATNRWNEDLASVLLEPSYVVAHPAIHEGDDLKSLEQAFGIAERELSIAMQKLGVD